MNLNWAPNRLHWRNGAGYKRRRVVINHKILLGRTRNRVGALSKFEGNRFCLHFIFLQIVKGIFLSCHGFMTFNCLARFL